MKPHNSPQHLWTHKNFCITAVLLTCLLVLPLSQASTDSRRPPTSAIVFNDDNLALLDVHFKRYRVGDGVEAFVVNDRTYLPLVDVFALLELNISTTNEGAAGWFIDDKYDFSLSQTQSGWLATVIGMEVAVPAGEIVQYYGMLYADIRLLEDWFGARFTLNFSQSLLTLSTQQELPFEKRIARNERIINKRQLPKVAANPLLDNPYTLAEVPSLDLSAAHFTQRNEKNDTGKETRTTYSVISHGDLGYMNSEVYVSGDREEGLSSASLRLQRFDQNASMLGPLGATHIGIGDISSPGVSLAPAGGSGRGIVINNKDLSLNQKSDLRVIEGDYHPGWDIELYQNGIVVGYQTIGSDGHYEFADIPLFLGNNRFILKFYGPGGKEETEERTLFLGANQDDVGKIKYSASIFQPNLKTININEINDERESYEQAVFSAEYGLSPNASVHAGFAHKTRNTYDAKNFYNLGLQSAIWDTNLLFDITSDDQSNDTYAFSVNQYIYRTNFRLGIIEYNKTDSSTDSIQRQFSFGASGRVFDTPYNLTGHREIHQHSTEDTYRLGTSGNVERLQWSNQFDYTNLSSPDDNSDSFNGNLFLGYSLNPINFRLGVNYQISPEAEVDSADLSTFFAIDQNTSVNFSTRYRPADNSTRYNLGLTWQLPYFQLTPSVSYDSNGQITGLVTVSASLGKRSSTQGTYYNLNRTRQANRGTFKARLFEDQNNNGYYEMDEPLLEGGEISATQSHRKGRSDSEGIAWLDRVSAWQQTDIAYEPGSIQAAPMVYTGQPFSVVMRPGSVTAVNMPFSRTGEIDGTIYRKQEGLSSPARGVRLSIINGLGQTVEQSSTDSYGFFLFEELRPDNYRLEVMNEAWLTPEDAQFIITSEGNAILDKKLLLGPAPQIKLKKPLSLLKESPSEVPEVPTANQSTKEKLFWTLQVASYGLPANAQKLETRLRKQGYTAFTQDVVVGKRQYTRVYAGNEISRDDALKNKTTIDRSINVRSMAVKLSSRVQIP